MNNYQVEATLSGMQIANLWERAVRSLRYEVEVLKVFNHSHTDFRTLLPKD